MTNYQGSRWYKCDFHLHTLASKCFKDKEITTTDFINKVKKEELDCIAITDHNTGAGIDEIKKLAEEEGITVFPGVEITCSDSKIHLLVLFDTDKDGTYVEDFLISLHLKRDDFGEQTAHIHKPVFDVIKKANELGAVVIPAHIDEHSGLSEVSFETKKRIFRESDISAVQIVHEKLLEPKLIIRDNIELLKYFHTYYESDEITYTQINTWKSCNEFIKDLSLLTFSDNPSEENRKKHSIWGIGGKYTWIKMNEKPSLESLRQALLLPELRIRNFYQSKENPYKLPKLWVESIKIKNTSLLEKGQELKMDFSPQMSTIIGGRGSGKSSFIHLLRGVFKKVEGLDNLEDIKKDFVNYYKKEYKNEGVFNKDSEIQVQIIMNSILYKITVKDIQSYENQDIVIERWNSGDKEFSRIENKEYLNLFNLDIYSQKQIYEIAKSPNALRERIDSAISEISEYKAEIENKESEYINKSLDIEDRRQRLNEKKMYEAKFDEVASQIKAYNESGISKILKRRNKFVEEEERLKEISEELKGKINYFEKIEDELAILNFDKSIFYEDHKKELSILIQGLKEKTNLFSQEIIETKEMFKQSIKEFVESIDNSKWKEEYLENKKVLRIKTKDLDENITVEIEEFENLLTEKENIIKELKKLKDLENLIEEDIMKCRSIYNEILNIRIKMNSKRSSFLNEILEKKNVRIEVRNFRDRESFERRFREIIQKPIEFETSISNLIDKAFMGKVPETFNKIREDLKDLRKDNSIDGYDGHFKNCIKNLNTEQFARLMVLLPEDEILAKYKSANDKKYKSISNASAGQKTATILTYILAHGDIPLILDQPEDDLDNRLVYELIVDRLREAKENRQIIIVTHNANIPVNGDAEYVTAMNSESKYIDVFCSGAIEDEKICDEICEVMEGGPAAFTLRSKRYNL